MIERLWELFSDTYYTLDGDIWECGNCGELYNLDGSPDEHNFNYCPNCGMPKTHYEQSCFNDDEDEWETVVEQMTYWKNKEDNIYEG